MPKGLTAKQKKGLAFEKRLRRAIGKWFPTANVRRAWIAFEDANGKGFAEIDVLVEFEDFIFVVEAKLSDKADPTKELLDLYAPLVQRIYPTKRVILVAAFRYCKGEAVSHLVELLDAPPNKVNVLHYL